MIKIDFTKENLITKAKLFFGMLVAANTAAMAIYLSLYFTKYPHDYQTCLGMFLAYRVGTFMANKGMPLIDENVAFMSSERTLWNTATIQVALVMALVFLAIKAIF